MHQSYFEATALLLRDTVTASACQVGMYTKNCYHDPGTLKRSLWSDHLQPTSNQSRRCTLVQRNWQGCSPWNECICKLSSETRKHTYPLQITVYDIEWMEISEALTNIYQLDKKIFQQNDWRTRSPTYQSQAIYVGMSVHFLISNQRSPFSSCRGVL